MLLSSYSKTFGECTEVPGSEDYLPEYTSHYKSTTDNYYFSHQHSGHPIHHVEHKPDKHYHVSSTCSSGPLVHNVEHGHSPVPHDEDKQYHTASSSHRTHMPMLCMPTLRHVPVEEHSKTPFKSTQKEIKSHQKPSAKKGAGILTKKPCKPHKQRDYDKEEEDSSQEQHMGESSFVMFDKS